MKNKSQFEPKDRVMAKVPGVHFPMEGVVGDFTNVWVRGDEYPVLVNGFTYWINKKDITLTKRSAGLKLL